MARCWVGDLGAVGAGRAAGVDVPSPRTEGDALADRPDPVPEPRRAAPTVTVRDPADRTH